MHETKDEVEKRYQFKQKLMRELIRSKKYSRQAIIATIYFVDYLLKLPEEETKKLGQALGPEIRKERGLMGLYNEENASPTVANSFAEQFDRLEREVERGMEQGLEKGLEQGISLEKQNIAKKLILENMPLEMISSVTDLNIEELEAIRATIRK